MIRYCKELENQEILTKIELGSTRFYTADRASNNFILEKRLYNIKSLYLHRLINYLKSELSNPVVILFGSYEKGEDTENSDIDLYIQTLSKKDISLTEFEKKLKRKIQVFRNKNITDIKNRHLANNILNGIVLNNFIEVFK